MALNDRVEKYIGENRKLLVTTFVAVFFFVFVAHGYRFAHLLLSHDSLNEFFSWGDIGWEKRSVVGWKVALGRFILPVYQMVFHGFIEIPWLSALLTTIWLWFTVYLICKAFKIVENVILILIAGSFAVNLSITSQFATYIGDCDANNFALFLATAGFCLWKRGGKMSLLAIPLITCVLGIYQSMISIFISLVIFYCILLLLENEDILNVLKKGSCGVLLLGVSGAVYACMLKTVWTVWKVVPASGYNSLNRLYGIQSGSWYELVRETYVRWVEAFVYQPSIAWRPLICLLNIIVLVLTTGLIIFFALKKGVRIQNLFLIVVLEIIMPFGMNVSYFLSDGTVHYLMMYSFWLIYSFLLILIGKEMPVSNAAENMNVAVKCTGVAVILLILFTSIQTANGAYIKKEMEENATFSTMTRVMYAIENTEGYEEGKTELLFVGTPQYISNDIYGSLKGLTGMESDSPISGSGFYRSYLKYVLGINAKVCSENASLEYNETVSAIKKSKMPVFPEKGFIQWYGDILVIRMS